MTPTREDLELYVMGAYDGDAGELERAIAADRGAADTVAREAELELLLREAAAAATFCPGCRDLVADGARCDACGAAARPGGYVVERVLVSNAHGRMYAARDADGKRVALKELAFVQSPSAAAIAAFEREAVLLRALDHPRIPRFCASFEEGTGVHVRYYLAQELVDGTPLDARLADHFYAEPEIADIARQVLEVLVYLQGLSPIVVHRDIKPANLLMRAGAAGRPPYDPGAGRSDAFGAAGGQIAVVDFGAAYVHGTTAGSTTIGTFGYMPIEQLAGQVDATTDTYALGATLLHLLTRREPWRFLQGTANLDGVDPSGRSPSGSPWPHREADAAAKGRWHSENVSPPMRAFLHKLVAAEPRDRFPSAAAALAALDDVVAGKAIVPVAAPAPKVKPARRMRLASYAAIAAAALALVGLGAGGYALLSRGGGWWRDHDSSMTNVVHVEPGRPALARSERLMRLHAEACSCRDLPCIESVARDVERYAASPERTDGPLLEGIGKCLAAAGDEVKAKMLAPPPPPPPQQQLPSGERTDLDVKDAPLHDVLRTLAERCKLGLVVPDFVDAKVTLRLKAVPCDQAFEVVLEANGLWYAYEPDGKLVRVGPRRDVLARREVTARRRAIAHDEPLPEGGAVDLDFKDAPLRDLAALLAASGGVNIVVPPHIDGKVTVRMKAVPWRVAFETTLASLGLGYRYRPNGKIVRVATRGELDDSSRP
ncbi:MAG: hypothetical protein KIT31_06260 [Deltaproteobacteria bacterium]|nr:hypothetical protein [Deltaproteobacteria bacterium]